MTSMDIHDILEHLPHRYPILLVDRMLEVVPGERIKALKNVSVNEPFFPGHYPHHPVMPGVLIVEAMAQAAAVLSFKTMGGKPDATTSYRVVGRRDWRKCGNSRGSVVEMVPFGTESDG